MRAIKVLKGAECESGNQYGGLEFENVPNKINLEMNLHYQHLYQIIHGKSGKLR